jgi:hypothetical protein
MGNIINPYRHAGGVDFASANLYDVLVDLEVDTNLEMCWDLRKIPGCYESGQTISDLSGNTADFNLGANSGESTDDPSLNDDGIYSADTYLHFDGGDHISHSGTNEAWITDIHKEGAAWTCLYCHWIPTASAGESYIVATVAALANQTGFYFRGGHPSTTNGEIRIYNGSGITETNNPSNNTVRNTWGFALCSIDEDGGSVSFWNIDGTNETSYDAAYSTPSAGAASYNMVIGCGGNLASRFENDFRLSQLCFWSRALSKTEASAIYDALDPTLTFGI